MEEMATNEFNDWEHLQSSTTPSHSSWSNHHVLTSYITTRNAGDDFSVFPPVNHEGLPVNSSLSSPYQTLPSSPSSHHSASQIDESHAELPHSFSDSSSPLPPTSHVARWRFAIAFLKSKIVSLSPSVPFRGLLCSIGCNKTGAVTIATFLLVPCMWVLRWRRRRKRQMLSGEGEKIQQLKLVIKEKDEKLFELLSHMAEMYELLRRYKNTVSRAPCASCW